MMSANKTRVNTPIPNKHDNNWRSLRATSATTSFKLKYDQDAVEEPPEYNRSQLFSRKTKERTKEYLAKHGDPKYYTRLELLTPKFDVTGNPKSTAQKEESFAEFSDRINRRPDGTPISSVFSSRLSTADSALSQQNYSTWSKQWEEDEEEDSNGNRHRYAHRRVIPGSPQNSSTVLNEAEVLAVKQLLAKRSHSLSAVDKELAKLFGVGSKGKGGQRSKPRLTSKDYPIRLANATWYPERSKDHLIPQKLFAQDGIKRTHLGVQMIYESQEQKPMPKTHAPPRNDNQVVWANAMSLKEKFRKQEDATGMTKLTKTMVDRIGNGDIHILPGFEPFVPRNICHIGY